MLSECYQDLVAETGERFSHVDCDEVAPALPLSSASLDETADRLVVGDANGVVWTWDVGVAASDRGDLSELKARAAFHRSQTEEQCVDWCATRAPPTRHQRTAP